MNEHDLISMMIRMQLDVLDEESQANAEDDDTEDNNSSMYTIINYWSH